MPLSRAGPGLMRLGPEAAEGWWGNEVGPQVEGVVDWTMGAEESLGGALGLELLLLVLSSDDQVRVLRRLFCHVPPGR